MDPMYGARDQSHWHLRTARCAHAAGSTLLRGALITKAEVPASPSTEPYPPVTSFRREGKITAHHMYETVRRHM